MAGTLFGLALSQQHDSDGKPLAGGKLYIFQAATQVPLQAYKDFALSAGQEHAHPIVLDSRGRVPAFWLDDGTARARLTDAAGVVQFDEDTVVLGPAIDAGATIETTVDPNALPQTGDFDWQPRTGTRTGWVRANARTIGSASSGASERANADTEDLFAVLWGRYSDALCPVSGGRGANAAADFAANKAIGLPDGRSRAGFGVDDMGNSAAGRINSAVVDDGDELTAMSTGGEDRHTLVESEIPVITPTAQPHNHRIKGTAASSDTQSGYTVPNLGSYFRPGGANDFGVTNNDADDTGNGGNGVALDIDPFGGGGAHNNMPPFMLGTWYIFLG